MTSFFEKRVLVPNCGDSSSELYEPDEQFLLSEYDIGRVIINSFGEVTLFVCVSFFIQAIITILTCIVTCVKDLISK